ncbi:MAG: fructose-6-phosphate aldolase [Candidatus Fischerbacteria bacterium RBG_13_37_8]|uniref:Probable transaldolase n=1 Tax=Candidatus Fischerbacteria bacterium RBG_13_37_8 TaxID=1817863 RepID=A0A1F5VRS6_9BACT|nr:MAG: fructose-6-phosphate aldolase [Candidatus Fischerbacteria bacterium RBG_13_37_8]
MKFFLDTANIKQIEEGCSLGIIDGVTTNPSLLSKEGSDYRHNLKRICETVKGPVSAEVISENHQGMIEEAKSLAEIDEHIVIKIPMTKEGMKAGKYLVTNGIKINVTLVFSPSQALIAAKIGATYISPFIGRLDDISHNGMFLIKQIKKILKNYAYKSEVIVASIRHPLHVVQSALYGADIATIPFAVLDQLFKHPLTDIGIERFLQDWRKTMKK